MKVLPTIAVLLLTTPLALGQDTAATWKKVDEGKTGERTSPTLLHVADSKQMLLVGPAKGAPFIQAFDLSNRTWSEVVAAGPTRDAIQPYYQTAYDPTSTTVYCLSGGPVLYAFNTVDKTWKTFPAAAELEGLSWHALACDPAGKRLVVVGSDKKTDNLGWLRTVVFDIPSGKWRRIEVGDAAVVKEHRELVAAREALIDIVGRIRLAWYRDPRGEGSDTERAALLERCSTWKAAPAVKSLAADMVGVTALLRSRKMLDALKAARTLQRKVEELTETQYPVPCSRRNSPLVFDAKNQRFLLFGGDHEDYLMNDTWILDVEKQSWRRAKPARAPSPRAGHALTFLPRAGKVALYEGYFQSDSTDYAARPYATIDPVQLWLYDVAAERWELARLWPLVSKKEPAGLAPIGHFHGYASQWFSPPALAADSSDTLALAAPQVDKRPAITSTLAVDPAQTDRSGTEKLGVEPNSRRYRVPLFRADFGEVADAPKATGLDELPANRWVKLPSPPKNPCYGCRGRDWGTSVWDSDRDQILLWGGGHCVRSASSVTHYSPVAGRSVEGFDADEPYGANGGGGFDSSVWNRPWVSVHNYKHYAYDPKSKLLVAGRGYLYDPERMDWLRLEPLPLPYRFEWGHTALATSRHGVVVWARKKTGEDAGLWLFDRDKGWTDLEPKGKLFVPYCDSHGLVYDRKRDRLILSGVGGGYNKTSNGTFLAFDFATKEVSTLKPENDELAKTANARELAYVEHADWMLVGQTLRRGDPKTGPCFTRIYDCVRNKMFLLEAGPVPDGYNVGWMCDARRKLVYSFTIHGEAYALRLDPGSAKLVEKAE
jgi:hypothetical protein